MREALFKVKASLSEYVDRAENGQCIEITRHGKTAALLVGRKEYEELAAQRDGSFFRRYNRWRQEVPEDFFVDEDDVFLNLRSRQVSDDGGIW